MFENLDIYSISLILFAISLGGFTKGVISFGLPLVSLPILSFVLNPKQAIFLLFFTVIAVNLREIKFNNFESYKKVYFLSLGVFIGIIIGSILFHKIENNLISQFIGFMIVLTAIINFTNLKIEKKFLLNKYFSTLYGLFCGVVGGITTLVGPLIAVYIVSLKLKKEEFSELISLTIFSCLIPIYSVFFIYQPVSVNDFLISLSLVIPAVLMQKFGFKIRTILSQDIFKKIILVVLTVIGSAVIFKNW
jgi:uncharacterized membrane protein YfcA